MPSDCDRKNLGTLIWQQEVADGVPLLDRIGGPAGNGVRPVSPGTPTVGSTGEVSTLLAPLDYASGQSLLCPQDRVALILVAGFTGNLNLVFPGANRSSPALYVRCSPTRLRNLFPVTDFGYRTWQTVVVPIFEELRALGRVWDVGYDSRIVALSYIPEGGIPLYNPGLRR